MIGSSSADDNSIRASIEALEKSSLEDYKKISQAWLADEKYTAEVNYNGEAYHVISYSIGLF